MDKVHFSGLISRDELVASLVNNMSIEQLVDFVVEIDELASDWDFTKQAAEYFSDEMDKYEEEGEDFARQMEYEL